MRVTTSVVVPLYASRKLSAVVYPTNAFDRSVTWEVVKNPDRVRLTDNHDGTALVEGLKNGTAVIRKKPRTGVRLCTVSVKLVATPAVGHPSSGKVKMGDDRYESYEIKIKRSPTYVSYPDVSITPRTSTDAEFVSVENVDGKWMVTGKKRGYAQLSVRADNGRVTRTLYVRVLDYQNPVT